MTHFNEFLSDEGWARFWMEEDQIHKTEKYWEMLEQHPSLEDTDTEELDSDYWDGVYGGDPNRRPVTAEEWEAYAYQHEDDPYGREGHTIIWGFDDSNGFPSISLKRTREQTVYEIDDGYVSRSLRTDEVLSPEVIESLMSFEEDRMSPH